jgi:opacity protein-like surface antigen
MQETLVVVEEITDPPYSTAAQSVGLTARTVNRVLDTNRWGVSARMSRRITKHLGANLRYSYNEQHSKQNTAGSSSDFGNHLVTLGVQYEFDRWHLW